MGAIEGFPLSDQRSFVSRGTGTACQVLLHSFFDLEAVYFDSRPPSPLTL
jgi:hypothetical protein